MAAEWGLPLVACAFIVFGYIEFMGARAYACVRAKPGLY